MSRYKEDFGDIPICRFGPGGDFVSYWPKGSGENYPELYENNLTKIIERLSQIISGMIQSRPDVQVTFADAEATIVQNLKSKNNLTPRQMQLLCLIKRFQDNNFYLPTIGELASELGISRSTTFEHIEELRKKGYLSNGTGKARSLELSSKAHKLPALSALQRPNLSIQKTEGIALAGRVAAGLPIEAIENKESLSIESCFGNTEEIFALEVQGDSMTGDGISDGDYVICRKSSSADNGQLVVAIVDEENATVKRFYKERNRARLQPSNDEYQAIYSEYCRIEAVVIGLIRKL